MHAPRPFVAWLLACASAVPASGGQAPATQPPPQTFIGRLSDSMCAGSHQAKASPDALTERQCIHACIRALAKYVLVDSNNQVMPIANQDAMGLPLYAGRPVRLTGERKGDAIYVTRVEAIPAHLHLGHVMTNWRDTPGTRGFLPVAIDEARVAVLHAKLIAMRTSTPPDSTSGLDDMKLHAGHVLHALDPAVEPKGPGAGYGVRKAAAGALQHLEFAANAEGATASVTTHALQVAASLTAAFQSIDLAITAAQQIRGTTDSAEAAKLAADLVAITTRLADDQLQQAHTHMTSMLKAEGILGAPR